MIYILWNAVVSILRGGEINLMLLWMLSLLIFINEYFELIHAVSNFYFGVPDLNSNFQCGSLIPSVSRLAAVECTSTYLFSQSLIYLVHYLVDNSTSFLLFNLLTVLCSAIAVKFYDSPLYLKSTLSINCSIYWWIHVDFEHFRDGPLTLTEPGFCKPKS